MNIDYVYQGSSISGPRAKSGPRRPNNWPAEQLQNAEEIYYNFFKIHLSVLTIYIFILIINERLLLVKMELSHTGHSVIRVYSKHNVCSKNTPNVRQIVSNLLDTKIRL